MTDLLGDNLAIGDRVSYFDHHTDILKHGYVVEFKNGYVILMDSQKKLQPYDAMDLCKVHID